MLLGGGKGTGKQANEKTEKKWAHECRVGLKVLYQ